MRFRNKATDKPGEYLICSKEQISTRINKRRYDDSITSREYVNFTKVGDTWVRDRLPSYVDTFGFLGILYSMMLISNFVK